VNTTLAGQYDAVLFDLDGTLFRGREALPGAPEEVAAASKAGLRVGYLTNNGSRSAEQVAVQLRTLGFVADARDVVTSGQAAARLLAGRLEPGSAVLVVGTEALAGEMTAVGLTVTREAERAKAVVQGHSPETAWRDLAEACLAIRAGALWVACNVDATLPDERGELPGNGAMVAALEAATEVHPLVAGKPEAVLFEEAISRANARRPLVVGDRLETDIAGANAVGLPSLLVLTGVSDATDVLTAAKPMRPGFLGADLAALRADPERVRIAEQPPWRAERDGSSLILSLDSESGEATSETPDPVSALRTLCAAHWSAGGGPVRVRGGSAVASEVLNELGLAESAVRQPGEHVG
jgi:glycerol 3-phosphatase-2